MSARFLSTLARVLPGTGIHEEGVRCVAASRRSVDATAEAMRAEAARWDREREDLEVADGLVTPGLVSTEIRAAACVARHAAETLRRVLPDYILNGHPPVPDLRQGKALLTEEPEEEKRGRLAAADGLEQRLAGDERCGAALRDAPAGREPDAAVYRIIIELLSGPERAAMRWFGIPPGQRRDPRARHDSARALFNFGLADGRQRAVWGGAPGDWREQTKRAVLRAIEAGGAT